MGYLHLLLSCIERYQNGILIAMRTHVIIRMIRDSAWYLQC